MVSYDDFKKLDFKSGKIVDVKDHPSADRLYVVKVDLGSEKIEVVAGIKNHYNPDELIGKNVMVLANLEPATIRGVESNGMIMAASDDSTMAVLTLDRDMAPGSTIK